MTQIWELIKEFGLSSGIAQFFNGHGWMNLVMIILALILIYLAVFKKVEPYLLLPISFGMLLANLPLGEVFLKPFDVEYSVESFVNFLEPIDSAQQESLTTVVKTMFENLSEYQYNGYIKFEYIAKYLYQDGTFTTEGKVSKAVNKICC